MAKIVDWNGNVVYDSPVESPNIIVRVSAISSSYKQPVWLTYVKVQSRLEAEDSTMIDAGTWVLEITALNTKKTLNVGGCIRGWGDIDWSCVAQKISRALGYNNWILEWGKS